jgi:hypothetical protein
MQVNDKLVWESKQILQQIDWSDWLSCLSYAATGMALNTRCQVMTATMCALTGTPKCNKTSWLYLRTQLLRPALAAA